MTLAVRAFAAALLGLAAAAHAQEPAPAGTKTEVLWELTPYYTSVGLSLPLSKEQLPDGGGMSEAEVYTTLFLQSLQPRLLLLEASVYPMPLAGVWLRKEHPGFYADARHLVEAVTTGFQEPWAVSVFVGSQMQFHREGEPRRDSNRGYMGYLVSAGNQHIRRNVIIPDNWTELEWKLKGERRFADERLSWSFRLGAKHNGNRDIADLYYLGIARSNLDFRSRLLDWLSNSTVSFRMDFTQHGSRLARQEVIIGKKLPLASLRLSMNLEIGVINERQVRYAGALADPADRSTTFVIRPNIEF